MLKKVALLSLVMVMCLTGFGSLIVNAASGLFPKMVSASTLYVYDIRNDSAEARLSALALQGLINQTSAQIYVLARDVDAGWLNTSGKSYVNVTLLSGSNAGLRTLYRDYQSSVSKLIVWDGNSDWTFNIGLMKGSLESGLPVTNTIRNSLISEFGSKTVEDIRTNWSGRVPAYDWALDNLMPSLNKKIIFTAGLRTTEPNPNDNWTVNPWLVFDYAVASKSFVFYLDPRNQSERDEIVKIVQRGAYSPGTSVLGYAPNGDELNATVNPYGIGYVVSDYYSNGSVWSSFPNKTYSQPAGTAINAQPGKVYVSIVASDGDNMQFDQGSLYKQLQSPARGQVPVGITISPAAQELASPFLDYFYANKTNNVELVAGPTGYQFIYPEDYSTSGYSTWLNYNKQWLIDAGIRTSQIWHSSVNSLSHKQMADSLVGSGVAGLFRGDDVQPISAYHGIYTIAQGEMVQNEGDIYNVLKNVGIDPARPVFHNIYPILAGYGQDANANPQFFERVKAEVDRLNADFPGKYVFLKPSDLIATINKLNSDIRGVNFHSNNTDAETVYLYEDNSSAMDNGHRYADGNASWIYKFDLDNAVTKGTLTMDIGGNYVVDISRDGINWSNAAYANGNLNRRTEISNISGWLTNNSSKTIYVRFKDGSTQDGNGPSLFQLSISTESSGVNLVTPSYSDNQYIIQNTGNIDNDHRFADGNSTVIYKFDLADSVTAATMQLDIAGEFNVDVSKDGVNWGNYAYSNSNSARHIENCNIAGALTNNPDKTIYVRFSDRTTNNGYGPSWWNLNITAS